MATKKTSTAATAAETQSSQDEKTPETASQGEAAPEQAATGTPETAPQGEAAPEQAATGTPEAAPQAKTATDAGLVGLEELELKHRVPGWQQAALMRLMGWQHGKKVTEAEYENALDRLNNRRQGGGRR